MPRLPTGALLWRWMMADYSWPIRSFTAAMNVSVSVMLCSISSRYHTCFQDGRNALAVLALFQNGLLYSSPSSLICSLIWLPPSSGLLMMDSLTETWPLMVWRSVSISTALSLEVFTQVQNGFAGIRGFLSPLWRSVSDNRLWFWSR